LMAVFFSLWCQRARSQNEAIAMGVTGDPPV
jgi:hypothetical protein